MAENISRAAKAVDCMEKYLRNVCLKDDRFRFQKLWENTFIKHQICKRKSGGTFSTCDHIRAMVYSMLTSSSVWSRFIDRIDQDTGRIPDVDEMFFNYDPKKLITCSPDALYENLRGSAGINTYKQMEALVQHNIPKLQRFAEEYGSVDAYYKTFESDDDPYYKKLIKALSNKGENKMTQMAEALNAEYLRNVGYNIPKPDTHVRRMLGKEHLACFDRKEAPIYDVFDIVGDIARELKKSPAEVDYILWSYCAIGYGGMCNGRVHKCDECVVKEYCETGKVK